MITKYYMPVDIHFEIGCLKELGGFLSPSDRVLLITDPGLRAVGLVERVEGVISPTGADHLVYDAVSPTRTPRW